MARKKSGSRAWLRQHVDDPYVRRARSSGYRSRASFKLLEIQQRERLLRPGMTVVDLGAAPGGWSQVAAELVGPRGRVFALDLLPMDALPGVHFLQGDFTGDAVLQQLLAALADGPVDVVLSDMAPNLSGLNAVDQPRSMYLVELALELATRVLRPGGDLVAKVFQGEGFDPLLRAVRPRFARVTTRKPAASRARSREVYLVARGYRP